jgi:hypothetical protein
VIAAQESNSTNNFSPHRTAALSRRDALFVLSAALFLTLSKGLHFLISNQHQYFVHGLRLADPNFIPNDWFTWQTTHHHIAFGYLLMLFQKIGPLVLTTNIAQFATMLAVSFAFLLLAKKFCKHPLIVWLALLLWIAIAGTNDSGLGKLYLISPYFQPNQISGPLTILGLALLFHRSFLAAGIALGFAGLFHGGIMVAAAPVVLVQALACGVLRSRKNLLRLALPLVLLWPLTAVPMILNALRAGPGDADAWNIITNFRLPHHYVMSQWPQFHNLVWSIWIALGAVAILSLPHDPKGHELRAGFLAALLTVALGLAFTLSPGASLITKAMLWRIAPWPFFLGFLVILDRWTEFLLAPRRRHVTFVAGFLVATAAWAFMDETPLRLAWLVAMPLAAAGAGVVKKIPARRAILIALALLMIPVTAYGLAFRSTLWRSSKSDQAQLASWLRLNTPPDSVLVVPPEWDMGALRIRARRPLVVDLKCFPFIVPSEIIEWHRRIQDVCGISQSSPISATRPGYLRLDTSRAFMLRDKYAADFVIILTDEHLGDLTGLPERFHNNTYRVLEIPPPPVEP